MTAETATAPSQELSDLKLAEQNGAAAAADVHATNGGEGDEGEDENDEGEEGGEAAAGGAGTFPL
jgi:hypothetical protein